MNNKQIMQTPKSHISIRYQTLSDYMISVFKQYRKNDIIICPIIFHGEGNKYVSLTKPQRWLDSIYKYNSQITKHITVHGFRHIYATYMKGQIATDVQTTMGHLNIQMTEHYINSTKDGQERLRNYLNGLGI